MITLEFEETPELIEALDLGIKQAAEIGHEYESRESYLQDQVEREIIGQLKSSVFNQKAGRVIRLAQTDPEVRAKFMALMNVPER